MDSIEKFVGFPEMNFWETWIVSFQLLPLVLWDLGCERSNRVYIQVEIIRRMGIQFG